jgi:recombination protein RecA
MNVSIDPKNRSEALDAAFRSIEKSFGKGAIMWMDGPGTHEVDSISSGCLGLDLALGIGGYPRGRLIEVFGPEASGKTTLALHAIASVQNAGGTAAFIDAEHALDPRYARGVGVQVERLIVSQPDSGEQALEIAEILARSGAVDIIVVDSVAALVPQVEIDGTMADTQVGLHARLMAKAMRKLAACVSRSRVILLFINQVRHKIGVTFGSDETTTGGTALRYFASVRLDIRRIGAIRQGEDVVGNRTRIRVVKNKLAPPFQDVEVDILYGKGISAAGDLIDQAEARGILARSGSWYSLGEERLGQGRERVRGLIEERPELRQRLEALVLGASGLLPDASRLQESVAGPAALS